MVSKLNIDREDDFRFHCAYLAYSKAWDENEDEESREKLNSLIESLSNDKINYYTFYGEINQFREKTDYQRGQMIQSQRKFEWRKKEAKKK